MDFNSQKLLNKHFFKFGVDKEIIGVYYFTKPLKLIAKANRITILSSIKVI